MTFLSITLQYIPQASGPLIFSVMNFPSEGITANPSPNIFSENVGSGTSVRATAFPLQGDPIQFPFRLPFKNLTCELLSVDIYRCNVQFLIQEYEICPLTNGYTAHFIENADLLRRILRGTHHCRL